MLVSKIYNSSPGILVLTFVLATLSACGGGTVIPDSANSSDNGPDSAPVGAIIESPDPSPPDVPPAGALTPANQDNPTGPRVEDPAKSQVEAPPEPALEVPAVPKDRHIVFFGDSLMDAPVIKRDERYPELVGGLIKKSHPNWHVINHGVGGNTTADGLARINKALDKADIVFICLGGNDFLRNRPAPEAKENLNQIIQIAKSRGLHPILAGLKGPALAKFVGWLFGSVLPHQNPHAYETMMQELAKQHSIPFLEDVLSPIPKAGWWESLANTIYFDPDHMVDPIHPNAKGHQLIADHVYGFLKKEIVRFEKSLADKAALANGERVFTLYFLGTASNSNDYQNADFWDGETVSTIAKLRQAGKEYIDYLIVDGPGSGANQHHQRFKHFGAPSHLENSSGQLTGHGVESNIENAIAVLKLENENPSLVEFVKGLKDHVAQNKLGPIRVINVVGWSRGAVSGIVFSRYLSKDPFFKDVRINLFAIDPVAGPFWGRDIFHLDVNVANYVGVYAENEYSQAFEAIVPVRVKGNEQTKVTLYSIPGKHASLVGADWNDASLRSTGIFVRDMAEQFLSSHGTRLHGASNFDVATKSRVLDDIRANKAGYFELGKRVTVTTNRDINSISGAPASPIRQIYLGLDESVCTFASTMWLCREYKSTTLPQLPEMIHLPN